MKRSNSPPRGVLVKRNKGELVATDSRTSDLFAPTVLLKGHDANVTSVQFAPGGNALASASHDKHILLWSVFGGECVNYETLKGHKKAVTSCVWSSDGGSLYSSGADRAVVHFDSETGKVVETYRPHSDVVNQVSTPNKHPALISSVGDDGVGVVIDTRESNEAAVVFCKVKHQLTTVAFGVNHVVFTGGLDNSIKGYDIRLAKNSTPVVSLLGHRDTVTGVSLSPDGSYLLSNARDNTVRIWDAKPLSERENRCLKIFEGATHNFENHLLRCAWSPNGSKVSAGSSDNMVCVWDTTSRKLIYRLPGHKGPVNDVQFHPSQPIVASCSVDQRIFLGEL